MAKLKMEFWESQVENSHQDPGIHDRVVCYSSCSREEMGVDVVQPQTELRDPGSKLVKTREAREEVEAMGPGSLLVDLFQVQI